MAKEPKIPDWKAILTHAAMLQSKVPGAVLVGGTAAALHARHRYSVDHDHVIKDLVKHYDRALSALESIKGWKTKRKVKGKLVLGEIFSIDAGLRNQRRTAPLETMEITFGNKGKISVPTAEEMLRIKAFLSAQRNATRDYLDVAALSHYIGPKQSIRALKPMNALYSGFAGEGGDMLTTLVVKFSHPEPYDLTEVDLSEYKGIVAPWRDWRAVEKQCRKLALGLLRT